MKTKFILPALLGLFACFIASHTQAQEGATATTNQAAALADVPTNTPIAEAAPAAAPAAVPAPGGTIPLIQFVDAPLTAVIENLARQAGMNYILDPKVSFGQPGPDGKILPQPTISIRWENLTAEQALYALLNNYDLTINEDPRTKIARIAPKDPAAPDPLVTKVIQLKFANPSNIVVTVQSSLTDKRSRVVADIRTSQLVVVATEKELVIVTSLINNLDSMTKQVLIEAKLIETSLNPKTSKGIDWSGTLQAQKVTFGNGVLSGTHSDLRPGTPQQVVISPTRTVTVTPDHTEQTTLNTSIGGSVPGLNWNTLSGFSPAIGFLNADGLSAVLSFLNTDSDAKVISTPRAVTLDNETANLSVTEARPIFKVTAGTANTTGGSEVTYTNLGTILQVTPRISANNFVNLKVIPEVSSFVNTVRKTINSTVNEADVFAFRRIDTQVLIPSGNTLVLGGLISDATTKGYTKVPLLGDIPILGMAFRKEDKERSQKNLLIFITPTIVKDTDFQPTTTDFLKTKPEEMSSKPWSALSSGRPLIHDWTKPFRKTPSNGEN